MNASLEPGSRSRVIVGLIIAYFVVVAYATSTNDPLAATVGALGFGVIAIAVGATVYERGGRISSVRTVAAGSLVGGGLLQLGAVVTGAAVLDLLSSLLVFLGVGAYGYAIWRRN
ncbi:hypothetical protein [Natrinema caseinilyticum]|uniref:hypothetical protein n=1 Tax=Natrinema caseinilyticum TaxID=2961570 RepID=UPI0020C3C0E3|nr:hypothetical protein [Natrinema caseinilyticum]